jgi:hypothetical protein
VLGAAGRETDCCDLSPCRLLRYLSHVPDIFNNFNQVLDAHMVAGDVPLISVIFETGGETEPVMNSIYFFGTNMSNKRLRQLRCTLDELALFKKLLFMNHLRMSPDYKPSLQSYESTFKCSFILSISPLGHDDAKRLAEDTGCDACGGKIVSRCSQCHLASYCGPGVY